MAGAGGRHHAGAQLHDDFFPLRGVVVEMRRVELGQRQAAGFQLFVVAAGAVLGDERGLRGNGDRERGE